MSADDFFSIFPLRRSQDGPRRAQDAFKRLPGRPKMAPRRSKSHPSWPMTRPRRAQDAPRRAQDAPKTPPDAPRWPQKAKTKIFYEKSSKNTCFFMKKYSQDLDEYPMQIQGGREPSPPARKIIEKSSKNRQNAFRTRRLHCGIPSSPA